MKRLLLAGTAFLALVASASGTRAVPFDFTYTGSLVTFTVPTTESYQILAFGAQGGDATLGSFIGASGLGAEIGGNFILTAGEILQIAVGGAGGDNGGGGGGSFVVGPGNTPLVIAGGGGGGGVTINGPLPILAGGDGLTGPDGGVGKGSGSGEPGAGGTGGNGGEGSPGAIGGGGGGFFSAGGNAFNGGTGGGAFPDLARGEAGGGFGGGGGAGTVGLGGSGGGGGYSGGGGGGRSPGTHGPGGGGGSFDAGIDQILVADFEAGDGEVVITELVPEPVSEPGTLALLGAGLTGLAVVRRRRRTD
jgi:hypothetical protein